jgi:hypothetical protein
MAKENTPVREFIVGLALGAALFGMFLHLRSPAKAPISPEGDIRPGNAFDLAEAPPSEAAPSSPAATTTRPTPRTRGPLSKDEVRPWLTRSRKRKDKISGIPKRYSHKAKRFVFKARKYEGKYAQLAMEHSRKRAVVREYGREWMKHEDLRRLNNDWFVYRDPIRFAVGAARSKNFTKLIAKYAMKSEFHAFLKDAVMAMPQDLSDSFRDYLDSDQSAMGMSKEFSKNTGISIDALAPKKKP